MDKQLAVEMDRKEIGVFVASVVAADRTERSSSCRRWHHVENSSSVAFQ